MTAEKPLNELEYGDLKALAEPFFHLRALDDPAPVPGRPDNSPGPAADDGAAAAQGSAVLHPADTVRDAVSEFLQGLPPLPAPYSVDGGTEK